MKNILDSARLLKNWSIEIRRSLHQNPELSLEEKQTSLYCSNLLRELGYEVRSSWGYGFTADLTINPSFKTIALRADMDALPIQEKNTHEFVSKNKGVAHMCGHDSHMTIALTTAKLLKEIGPNLPVNLRFLFQPSEEKIPGGAKGMIDAGCLDGVDEVYGLHNDPGTEVGKIKMRNGPMMASGDRFDLTIFGKGGHAAKPQDGLNPILPATQLINQWQAIISQRINPVHPAVLNVTQINSGDTFNVVPDYLSLAGTVRTFYLEDRELIHKLMHSSLEMLKFQGYDFEFNYLRGYDPVVNHKIGVQRVEKAATAIIEKHNIDIHCDPIGLAEDFGYYLQHRPGAIFILGSGNSSKGITHPLHSSQFDIDEETLVWGAAIMSQLVLEYQ